MTVRDPYTGVEQKASPRPRSFVGRWWPLALIVAILLVASIFEWRHATLGSAPRSQSAGTSASAPTPAARLAGSATPQPAASDELARAIDALNRATDQLTSASELMLGIAALQAIVLAGQLYFFGLQRRAAARPSGSNKLDARRD